MKVRGIAIAVFIGILFCSRSPGLTQGKEIWTNLNVALTAPFAEDFDNDGILDIPASEGNMSVMLSGSNGKVTKQIDSYSNSIRFADMDKDGVKEIVISVFRGGMTQGSVIAVDKKSWNVWKTVNEFAEKETAVFTLYDFDGDGFPEILGQMDTNLKLINFREGVSKWIFGVGRTNPGAALADVTGDGRPEIAAFRWVKKDDGQFRYFDQFSEFRYNIGLSIIDPITGKEINTVDNVGFPIRSPIAADLSGTGTDDVLVFSRDAIFIIRDGEIVPIFQRTLGPAAGGYNNTEGAPEDMAVTEEWINLKGGAVGDFHSQFGVEIVAITKLNSLIAIAADGKILWETPTGEVQGQPVIADVNGDNAQEIIVATAKKGIVAYDGESGKEVYLLPTIFSPTKVFVADVNGDGNIDIVTGGMPGVSALTMAHPGKIEWASEFGDSAGTGNYKISKQYAERMANPMAFRKFPVVKVATGVIIFLAVVGGVIFGVRQFVFVRKALKAPELTGELARLEQAYEKNRNDSKTILALAREYAKNNIMGVRAIEVYRKSLALTPNDTAIITAAANTYLSRKMVNPECERVYQMALGENPKDVKFLEKLVRLYLANNRVDAFPMTIYYRFFSSGSFDAELAKSLATELCDVGSKEPFSSWLYQQVLHIDSGNMTILMALLASLKEQNSADEYLTWANQYIADQRLNNEMRQVIAQDLRAWGREEEARRFMGVG